LIAEPGLLLLDEPTNHLDADTIDWLEGFLSAFSGAVLLVTHDRYFLDRVADRVLEIEGGVLREYPGNFSAYLERKREQAELEESRETRRRNLLRRELEWLRRGAQARSTKQKARVQRAEELRDRKAPVAREALLFRTETRRLGNKVIEAKGISKAYAGKTIVRDFTHVFARGERLGIIGPNGCGKTTLVKMLEGSLKPDTGSVEWGETLQIAHYDQESAGLNLEQRAIDYIKEEGGENLRAPDGSLQSASVVMEAFHFPPRAQYAPVGKLSGGERRRLYLVKTLMSDPNFLILDEPTNDLDIATLQALEDYLDGFKGCLLVVSHDRYFLDRVVDRVLSIERDGSARFWPGSYSVYASMREAETSEMESGDAQKSASGKKIASETSNEGKAAPDLAKSKKLGFKERREFETLEQRIGVVEDRLRQIDREMAESATDHLRLRDLMTERNSLQVELEASLRRWEELAERA
jgi:ATP-binding cassette subfamily F protein uup